MMDGLRYRIEPWPHPKIGVFMNKAKLFRGNLTRETEMYWGESRRVCEEKKRQDFLIEAWDSFIPERVDIKRAIPGGRFPADYETYFSNLWDNVERTLEP
jgi:chromosome partitioning protein